MKRSLLLLAALVSALTGCRQNEVSLYVGTYGDAIHILRYDARKGITGESCAVPAADASFLALTDFCQDGPMTMVAVSERGSSSAVCSFSRQGGNCWSRTGVCDEVGDDPCFILAPQGTSLVATADYSGGSFSLFDAPGGVVSSRRQVFDEGVHVHQIREIPGNIPAPLGIEERYFLVTDLGLDLIYVERLSEENLLEEVGRIDCRSEDGMEVGPRHMEFNARAGVLYCLSELSGEVMVWRIGADSVPVFSLIQRVKADPNDAHGSADIHLHPSGRWLYTSHRLEGDGIACWSVAPDGRLEENGYTPTGSHPRNFCFSPDGRRVLVACRDTGSIQIYPIDRRSGRPGPLFQEYFLGSDRPVCLVFAQ